MKGSTVVIIGEVASTARPEFTHPSGTRGTVNRVDRGHVFVQVKLSGMDGWTEELQVERSSVIELDDYGLPKQNLRSSIMGGVDVAFHQGRPRPGRPVATREQLDRILRMVGVSIPRETGAEWRKRMVEETEGMKPGEILEHLNKDYQKNGPPPRLTADEMAEFIKDMERAEGTYQAHTGDGPALLKCDRCGQTSMGSQCGTIGVGSPCTRCRPEAYEKS